MDLPKRYVGSIKIGESTDTQDASGKVVARGKPITENVTDAEVAFDGDLAKLRGKRVSLRFGLTKAKLYAFAFGR